MKQKNCLIWGASGQIGRNLIRKLTKNNFRVTAVTRNSHKNGYILKTQANPGFLDIVETNIFDTEKINQLTRKADLVINLIGILYEESKFNSFENIHVKFPYILSKYCRDNNVEQLIHLSALGVEKAIEVLKKEDLSKLDYPKNLYIYGLSSLAPLQIDLIQAFSKVINIKIYIISPCNDLWQRCEARRLQFRNTWNTPPERQW